MKTPLPYVAFLLLVFTLLPTGLSQGGHSFYFHVVDCEDNRPIHGATVIVLNRSYKISAVSLTNATGHALVTVPRLDIPYEYFVSMQGYRTRSGESVFYDGIVFSVCLIKTTAGFWNIIASVSMWQGDIHAGGLGWAMLRLKNLESGVFNITELQIWVAGYDKPVTTASYPNGLILAKLVDKQVNITVSPPPDAPVGKLKAELRWRATFIQDDGARLGPATMYADLDYVTIQPYRTFSFSVLDMWGINRVPKARTLFTDTLTGTVFAYEADGEGRVEARRLPDRAYRFEVLYDSPYDRQTHKVYDRFEILVDMVKRGTINAKLFEVNVNIRDMSGRRLNTTVALGYMREESINGLAVFKNVPRGVYTVKSWWMGVESFNGSLSVDEPLVVGSPGGSLDAVANVGDLIIHPRDWEGKKVGLRFTARASPLNITASGEEVLALTQLPPGSYRVVVTAYNSLLGREVEVGSADYIIPGQHGTHELRLRVYDVKITFQTSDGRPAPLDRAELAGLKLSPSAGSVKLYNITAGKYPLKAYYMDTAVLDTEAVIEGPEAVISVAVHPLKLRLKTVDGEPLETGSVSVKVGKTEVKAPVKNGEADLGYMPGGRYTLSVSLSEAEVYRSEVDVSGGVVEASVKAGRPAVKVINQHGKPLQAEVEVAGVAKTATGADGVAKFTQVPLRDYPFRVIYMGVEVSSGALKPGQAVEVRVKTVTLVVKAVNELGSPIEADIDLSRAGKILGRSSGTTASFREIPAGTYSLTATYGAKQVSMQITVDGDKELTVTVPVAVSFGPLHLSMQEFFLPAALMAGVAVIVVVLRLAPYILRGGGR